MQNHPAAAHPVQRLRRGQQVADAGLALLGLHARQGDVVGGVQRQRDAVLRRLGAQLSGCLLPHRDTAPALVFVSRQPQALKVSGNLQRGLVAGLVKGVGIPGRTEFRRHGLSSFVCFSLLTTGRSSARLSRKRSHGSGLMGCTRQVNMPTRLPPRMSV